MSAVEADHRDVAGVNDRQQLSEAEAAMRARVNRELMAHVTFRDPAADGGRARRRDWRRRRAGAQRGAARPHEDRPQRAHRRRRDPDERRGRRGRRDQALHRRHRRGDRRGGDHRPVRAPAPRHRHRRPRRTSGTSSRPRRRSWARGRKANHLSYLGDAEIGEKVNVGAGTITCNYNGYEKFTTVIEDGAFIGSDSQLVAPVRIGKRAVIAAGTTVTRDVGAGALALSRAPQIREARLRTKASRRTTLASVSPVRIFDGGIRCRRP